MAKSATISFDSCVKQCDEIIAQMKSGHYAPLYLLHGAEGYFIDRIESFLSENALSDDQKVFNQVIIYGKDSTGADVANAAKRYPMMNDRQVVVVREAQVLSGLDDLAHYVASPLASTILLIAHRDKTVDKRSSFYKKISAAKGAVIFESVAPRDYEVGKFVASVLAEKGLRADPNVLQMISDSIGANLIRISSEIDKLVTRLGTVDRMLTVQDVEDNIGISKQFNNFELTKALSFRRFDTALKIAEHLSANSKETPLVLTITALFTHFQRVVTLGFLRYEAQQQHRQLGNDFEVARMLKLPNAYFLDEYKTAATNYPLAKSVAILGLLREWDLKSKGMNAGSTDESELLRDLILRIALL